MVIDSFLLFLSAETERGAFALTPTNECKQYKRFSFLLKLVKLGSGSLIHNIMWARLIQTLLGLFVFCR